MKWQQPVIWAVTLTCALANEHDRDREREREGEFRDLDDGRTSWWIWGLAAFVFIFCLIFACAAYMYDFSGDDSYGHHEGPSAYARAETVRPFPTMPAKKHRHKHHHRKSGDSNFLVPMFSNMVTPDPAINV
jgi:hypothetical protein